MSSLDKFPDWDSFRERPVPFEVRLQAPSSEIKATLEQQSVSLNAGQQKKEQESSILVNALVQQANYVFRLAKELARYERLLAEVSLTQVYEALRSKKDEMLDALYKIDLKIEDPLGQPYDAVKDYIVVQGWLHQPDFTTEMVVEVYDPIVIYRGTVVQEGHVVMGAPSKAKNYSINDIEE